MKEPVFKKILSDDWTNLGEVVRRHYFLKPYSDDYICVKGRMSEVYHSNIAKIFLPFGLLFGAVVPWNGEDIEIDVHYNSNSDSGNIYWNRIFKFPNKHPHHFRSHMEHVKGNEVIEFVKYGVGMRLAVTAEDGALVFRDKGYIWRMFGKDIPLPIHLIFGRAYVEERPINETEFSMKMNLCHPLFGDMFRYSGTFSMPTNT